MKILVIGGNRFFGKKLCEIHGNLVNLTFFNNQFRKEAFEVRSGFKKSQNDAISGIFS